VLLLRQEQSDEKQALRWVVIHPRQAPDDDTPVRSGQHSASLPTAELCNVSRAPVVPEVIINILTTSHSSA